MGKIFNKSLDKNDEKEGLFKRLKNIKDKNKQQLQVIKDQREEQLKELKNIGENKTLKIIDKITKKNDKANKLVPKFKKIDKILSKAELVCTKTDEVKYDFNLFLRQLQFIESIHNYEITLDKAIEDQRNLEILINKLNNGYNPKNYEKNKRKKRVLESAKKLSDARKDVINLFVKGIFPYRGTKEKEESEEESDENKFFKDINNESEGINYELFEKHFKFSVPTIMVKTLFETKNKRRKSVLVNLMNSGLRDLEDQIKRKV